MVALTKRGWLGRYTHNLTVQCQCRDTSVFTTVAEEKSFHTRFSGARGRKISSLHSFSEG